MKKKKKKKNISAPSTLLQPYCLKNTKKTCNITKKILFNLIYIGGSFNVETQTTNWAGKSVFIHQLS